MDTKHAETDEPSSPSSTAGTLKRYQEICDQVETELKRDCEFKLTSCMNRGNLMFGRQYPDEKGNLPEGNPQKCKSSCFRCAERWLLHFLTHIRKIECIAMGRGPMKSCLINYQVETSTLEFTIRNSKQNNISLKLFLISDPRNPQETTIQWTPDNMQTDYDVYRSRYFSHTDPNDDNVTFAVKILAFKLQEANIQNDNNAETLSIIATFTTAQPIPEIVPEQLSPTSPIYKLIHYGADFYHDVENHTIELHFRSVFTTNPIDWRNKQRYQAGIDQLMKLIQQCEDEASIQTGNEPAEEKT